MPEYNGRWYNQIRAWRVVPYDPNAPATPAADPAVAAGFPPAPDAAPAPFPPAQPAADAPAAPAQTQDHTAARPEKVLVKS